MSLRQGFSIEDNRAFMASDQFIQARLVRVIFLVFIVLYGFFVIIDYMYFPESWRLFMFIRFGIVIPVLISTIILSYTRHFYQIYQPYVTFNLIVGGLGIAFMLMIYPDNMIYYGGMFMIYFSGYLLLKLRFYYALVGGWSIFVLHTVGTLLTTNTLTDTFYYGALFFIGSNLIGMLGAYNNEKMNRIQFLRDREILRVNNELRDQYREKALQMNQLETSIKEKQLLEFENEEKDKLTHELKQITNRFEQIAEQSRTIYYEIDTKGKYNYVSSSIKSILGYTREEVISHKYFYDFFPEEQRDQYKEIALMEMQKETIISEFVNPLLTKDNKTIWVSTHLVPVHNKQGKVIAYRGSDNDITDRKNAEDNMKIFMTITDQAKYGSALSTFDGKLIYVNEALAKMHGYEVEELLGNHLSIVHNHSQMVVLEPLIQRLMETGFFPSKEVWHTKKDGSIFPTIMTGKTIFEDNKPKYISATMMDITELKQTQDELLETEKRYRIVSEISTTGVWEYNLEKNYLWCSPEYFKMLGYHVDDFQMQPNNLQQTWYDLLHPDDLNHAKKTFKNFVENKPKAIYENHFRMRTAEGDYKWIWSRGNFIPDKNNQPTNFMIGIHIDVTEQKTKQDEITYISYHDFLTDIPNRRYYQEKLDQLNQETYFPLTIIIMDLNGLKVINDAFGHHVGNIALKNVATTLQSLARDEDVVARIGGDEFAMIMPNSDQSEINDFLTKLKNALDYQTIEGVEYSIALGYETKYNTSQSIRDVLKSAENHMYKNKVLEGSSMRNRAIMGILKTLTDKYKEEKVHSERVSHFCKAIGKAMHLNQEDIKELEFAGLLHDIGKISMPDSILNKSGPLTTEEWEIMRTHTHNGYQILRTADEYSDLAEYAMSHHERMDGTGYPNRLKGHQIPLFSRIISVADAYEAMTSDRPYRQALKSDEAIAELVKHSKTQFDHEIVKVFIEKVIQK